MPASPSSPIAYISPGVIRVTDKRGGTTELRFTADGSLQQVTDPLGRTSRFTYDSNGRAVEAIAADSSVTRFSYDAAGRLISQTNALNQVETYSYAPGSDQPSSLVDGKGNPLTYSYDSQGKVSSIGYADGSRETFTYNSTNQLIQKVERSGDTFTYSYTPRGLLASRGGSDFSETYSYDSQDRLIGVTRSAPGGGSQSVSYTYDSEGRRASCTTSDGATVRYSYDSAGRLKGLRDGSNQSLVSYLYDGDGRLIQENKGNGTSSSYSYDAAGQLLRIDNRNPSGLIVSSLVYTYDLLGRRTSETSSQGAWSYSYDAIGQLVGAVFTSSNPGVIANQSRQYVYDAAGNRVSTLVNGVATSYSSNALNQYTTVGGAAYSYDADGNLLGDGVRSYQYNSENRMIRATAGADVWDYEYDLLGNRSAVIHNGQRTSYLVDPFAGFGDVVGTYNGDGSLQARYVHGNGLVAGFNNLL